MRAHYKGTVLNKLHYPSNPDPQIDEPADAPVLDEEESPLAVTEEEVDEEEVVEIIGHHGSPARRKYHVLWASGDETEEDMMNLVDIVDGECVVTEALLQYWDNHEYLRPKE